MKVLVAEDGPLVGDAFSEALRARYHTVFRAATEDTVNRLSDGEIDVGILDVQLNDGTAWDVLDRIQTPHPPFRLVLASAVDATPPARFSYIPLFRKPLDFEGLQRAVEQAVPFKAPAGNEPGEPKRHRATDYANLRFRWWHSHQNRLKNR